MAVSNRARAPCLRRLLLAAVLPPPERAPPPLHSHHTYKHKHKHKLITHRVMVLKRGSSVGVSTTRSAATARSRAASTPNTRVSHSMMGTLEAAAPPSEVGEGEVGAPSLSASVLGAAACGRGVGGRGKGAVGGGGGRRRWRRRQCVCVRRGQSHSLLRTERTLSLLLVQPMLLERCERWRLQGIWSAFYALGS